MPSKGANIRLSFVDANPHPRIEPFDRLDTRVSYFIGNDPEQWRPDVPVWGGVRYVDVYPGVDLEITDEAGQMVQRLVTQPGTDLSTVRLRVEGADVAVVDGNVLRLSTAVGEADLPLPLTEGSGGQADVQEVGAQAFDVVAPFAPVRFDPTVAHPQSSADNPTDLLYSTFLGGSNGDDARDLEIDESGRAYITGVTCSTDFPTTPGAFDRTSMGRCDVLVSRLNPTGDSLEYSTFVGGSNSDFGLGIAVDSAARAYVTGYTYSSDLPTTFGAFDTVFNGGDWDDFVFRLDTSGSRLEYSTYLGGHANDDGNDIAVDSSGQAFVTGRTFSADFPATFVAYGGTFDGHEKAFAARLDPTGSNLEYSAILGDGFGLGVTVDDYGRAYVTGYAWSGFPTTLGAFDRSFNGGSDAFVVRLNPNGNGLV